MPNVNTIVSGSISGGSFSALIQPVQNTNITTTGNGTLTALSLIGGLITRSGPTGNFTDTTDTGTAIGAALPTNTIGQSWQLIVSNVTTYIQTIAAGTNVTLSGLTPTIPPNCCGIFIVTYSAANTVTMNLVAVISNMPGSIQFGSGAANVPAQGNISKQISSAGVNPGATAADNVLAVFSIPASSFDVAGRGVSITAAGSFAANTNNKRIKIIFNPTTAVVGSTVGTGGTTVADTSTVTTNGGGWSLQASVFKYGSAGSNTQIGVHQQAQVGGAVAALLAPSAITATENGAILVAVTGNATTTATDIVFNFLEVNAMN